MKNILILGIGNLVLNDAGVGIHIVHLLKSFALPDGVDIVDGGVGDKTLINIMQMAIPWEQCAAFLLAFPAITHRNYTPTSKACKT